MPKKAETEPKITDEILADLETLRETTDALDEVLKDFDNYDADDAIELCEQIEELAQTIRSGVTSK